MSINIMNRIWWREDLAMMEKYVALAIADAADDEGVAHPAVATIALKCSCSERAVQKAVKALCGKMILRKMDRKDRSSRYMFVLENLPHIERQRRPKETRFDAVRTGEPHSPDLFVTGERHSPTGERHSPTGERGAPRTIEEPSEEHQKEIGDFEQSPADPEEAETIHAYVERRWHELKEAHPGIADVRKIDDGLAKMIAFRANAHAIGGEGEHAVWDQVFACIERSAFLQGRVPPGQNHSRPFKLTLAWLCAPKNFREVIGGRYDGDTNSDRVDPASGRRLGPSEQALNRSVARLGAAGGRSRSGRDPGSDRLKLVG